MHGYRHQLLCTRCMVTDVNCCAPDAWLQTSIAVHQMHGYKRQLLCTRCMVTDVNCCAPDAWLETSSAVCHMHGYRRQRQLLAAEYQMHGYRCQRLLLAAMYQMHGYRLFRCLCAIPSPSITLNGLTFHDQLTPLYGPAILNKRFESVAACIYTCPLLVNFLRNCPVIMAKQVCCYDC